VAVALLVMATVLGVLAIAVSGGLWLIVLAIACIVGVIALDRAVGRPAPVTVGPGAPPEPVEVVPDAESGDVIERAAEPLLFLVLLVLLAVGAFVILRLILSPEAGHGREATRPPGTGSGSSNSAPASTPPGSGGPNRSAGSGSSGGGGSSGYVTASAGVHLRAGPSTASAIVATMPAFATPVGLSCYEEGQPVATEPYWYPRELPGRAGVRVRPVARYRCRPGPHRPAALLIAARATRSGTRERGH